MGSTVEYTRDLAAGSFDPNAEHAGVIARLSDDLDVPLDEVGEIYREQLDRLAAGARIRSFLPLLAARNTRSVLRRVGKRHARGKKS
jgi:Protein of unknown function (DUF3562)